MRSSTTAGYDTVHGTLDPKNKHAKIDGPVIRQQLKCCKTNQDEMEKYYYQMELILENIFGPNDSDRKKNPKHWMYKMTNIVGGLEYQHAHADQGWGMDFEDEKVFPFVATHGFGVHPFQLWLLTKGQRGKHDYGFLHTLPPTAMLFMRGDFIHAGGVSWFPRCHMKFYPRVSAGLVKDHQHHYWLHPEFQCDIGPEKKPGNQDERSFLWQHYAFPFAYPSFYFVENKKSREIEEIVKYEPSVTHGLMDSTKEDQFGRGYKPAPHKVVETPI
jgi:hypothetical protein